MPPAKGLLYPGGYPVNEGPPGAQNDSGPSILLRSPLPRALLRKRLVNSAPETLMKHPAWDRPGRSACPYRRLRRLNPDPRRQGHLDSALAAYHTHLMGPHHALHRFYDG